MDQEPIAQAYGFGGGEGSQELLPGFPFDRSTFNPIWVMKNGIDMRQGWFVRGTNECAHVRAHYARTLTTLLAVRTAVSFSRVTGKKILLVVPNDSELLSTLASAPVDRVTILVPPHERDGHKIRHLLNISNRYFATQPQVEVGWLGRVSVKHYVVLAHDIYSPTTKRSQNVIESVVRQTEIVFSGFLLPPRPLFLYPVEGGFELSFVRGITKVAERRHTKKYADGLFGRDFVTEHDVVYLDAADDNRFVATGRVPEKKSVLTMAAHLSWKGSTPTTARDAVTSLMFAAGRRDESLEEFMHELPEKVNEARETATQVRMACSDPLCVVAVARETNLTGEIASLSTLWSGRINDPNRLAYTQFRFGFVICLLGGVAMVYSLYFVLMFVAGLLVVTDASTRPYTLMSKFVWVPIMALIARLIFEPFSVVKMYKPKLSTSWLVFWTLVEDLVFFQFAFERDIALVELIVTGNILILPRYYKTFFELARFSQARHVVGGFEALILLLHPRYNRASDQGHDPPSQLLRAIWHVFGHCMLAMIGRGHPFVAMFVHVLHNLWVSGGALAFAKYVREIWEWYLPTLLVQLPPYVVMAMIRKLPPGGMVIRPFNVELQLPPLRCEDEPAGRPGVEISEAFRYYRYGCLYTCFLTPVIPRCFAGDFTTLRSGVLGRMGRALPNGLQYDYLADMDIFNFKMSGGTSLGNLIGYIKSRPGSQSAPLMRTLELQDPKASYLSVIRPEDVLVCDLFPKKESNPGSKPVVVDGEASLTLTHAIVRMIASPRVLAKLIFNYEAYYASGGFRRNMIDIGIYPAGGSTKMELCSWLEPRLPLSGWWASVDGVRLESQVVQPWQAYLARVYKKSGCRGLAWYRKMLSRGAFTKLKGKTISAKLPPVMFSGVGDTYFGGSIVMTTASVRVCGDLGYPVLGIDSSDDLLLFGEGEPPSEEVLVQAYLRAGLEVRVKVGTFSGPQGLENAEFCSCNLYYAFVDDRETLTLLPKAGKVIYKIGTSSKPIELENIRGGILSRFKEFMAHPLLRPVALRFMYLTRRAQGARTKNWFPFGDGFVKPSQSTVAAIMQRYSLTTTDLEEWESFVGEWQLFSYVDHPILRMILEVDL
jgi:hypothetical protein